jgi:hypothetical protein
VLVQIAGDLFQLGWREPAEEELSEGVLVRREGRCAIAGLRVAAVEGGGP